MTAFTDTQRRNVQDLIVKPMTELYGPRYADAPEMAAAAAKQYVEDLAEFGPAVLEEAWRAVRRTHRARYWPLPPVLRAACEEVQQRIERACAAAGRTKPGSKTEYWDLVHKRTKDAVAQATMGTIAAEAKREGWDWHLQRYARKIAWFQAQCVVRHALANAEITLKGYRPDQIEGFHLRDMLRDQDISIHFREEEIRSMKGRARCQAATFKGSPNPYAPAVETDENYSENYSTGGPEGPEPPPIEADLAEQMGA